MLMSLSTFSGNRRMSTPANRPMVETANSLDRLHEGGQRSMFLMAGNSFVR